MFIKWESLLDIVTEYCQTNNFMEMFENSANNEKVAICLKNDFIRDCLTRWMDSIEFDDSLKSSTKSKMTRLEANEEFKMNNLELCCKLYTNAAQFAPHNSLEFALAFSNRSAVYIKLHKFQECLKDIDISLGTIETIDAGVEFNRGQLIVKLLKRKIECLMGLNEYKKAQISWKNLLELSKKVYKISLEDEFVTKCKVLSNDKYDSTEVDSVEKDSKIVQPTVLTHDLIKQILEKNQINLPYKSPKLELRFTEAKGRHFVASTKIKYGELLIFENPFAFVILPEYYDAFCYNCCMPLKNYSVPCNHCSTILFCGQKCRQDSWDSYHRWECRQGTSIFKCIGIAHLALRLSIKTLQPASNKDEIYNLLTHIDVLKPVELLQYTLTASLLTLYLEKKTHFFQNHPNLVVDLDLVGSELLHHMTRLICNGNALSTHMMSDFEFGTLSSVVDESNPRIGTAIFPTASLLNHSCDPNIFSSNILNYSVIKASRNIDEGEEITNCYGPFYRRMRFSERQFVLNTQYHFKCECCACQDQRTNDKFFQIVEGLICLVCKNKINATLSDLDSVETVHCGRCRKTMRASEYKNHLNKADNYYHKGLEELVQNNFVFAKKCITEALKLYTKISNPKSSNITRCEDSLAKCYAASGDFKNSYIYMDKCFPAIEERFGKKSLEVAYELDKMTDIMVNHLDMRENWNFTRKTLVYVSRAKEIFHANLSAWDIPYSESGTANIKYKENILLQLLNGKF